MKTIEVAAAACLRGGRLFIAQRGDGGESAGKWELPGGKLEEGESGEEAVVREIREELDSTIEVEEEMGTVVHRGKTFLLIMRVYRCRLVEGCFTLKEHIAKRWVGREDLEKIDWAEADRKAIPLLESLFPAREDESGT